MKLALWIAFVMLGTTALWNFVFSAPWAHSDSAFVVGAFCGAVCAAMK